MSVFLGGQTLGGSNGATSVYNAYTADLYLYITGKHPLLNAGPYSDYQPQERSISLTGNAQTITVTDDNIWGV